MLVLSRKKDEQIVVNIGTETVLVRVLQVDGKKVRLGITAPPSVAIHRDEVWKRQAEFAENSSLVSKAL